MFHHRTWTTPSAGVAHSIVCARMPPVCTTPERARSHATLPAAFTTPEGARVAATVPAAHTPHRRLTGVLAQAGEPASGADMHGELAANPQSSGWTRGHQILFRPHTGPQRADLRATYNERYIRAELSLPRTREPPSASGYRSDVPLTGRVGGTSNSVCVSVCVEPSTRHPKHTPLCSPCEQQSQMHM